MPDARFPLILLSAMGADGRLFDRLRVHFPHIQTPKWIAPLPRETLPAYAARFAKAIDPGVECFIGGSSFGGMVAVEAARHLNAKACFLIGSSRSPAELPRRLRVFAPVAPLAGFTVSFGPWFARAARATVPCCLGRVNRSVNAQLCDADRRFLRWAAPAVLKWRASDEPSRGQVFQIHGSSDRILPCRRVKADLVIQGAGHFLALTHADEIAAFMRERMG